MNARAYTPQVKWVKKRVIHVNLCSTEMPGLDTIWIRHMQWSYVKIRHTNLQLFLWDLDFLITKWPMSVHIFFCAKLISHFSNEGYQCTCSVTSVMSNSLQLHGLQHARFSCPSSSPGACSNSCPLSQWCYLTNLILCLLLLLLPSIFPSIRVFSNESVLCIRWPKYQSLSFSISPSNEYSWFPLGLTGWISLQSKGLSKAQFEIINSSALSLLYGPALTCVHDYWKNHSFDYMDLCWQSSVSAF